MNKMNKIVLILTSLTIISLTSCKTTQKQPNTQPESSSSSTLPAETITQEQLHQREIYQQQLIADIQNLNRELIKLQIQARESEYLAIKQLDANLTEILNKIQQRNQLNAELNKNMGKLTQQLQQQPQPSLHWNDLLQQQVIVGQKLEALLLADERSWEQARSETEDALAHLKQSYEKLVTERSPKQTSEITKSPTIEPETSESTEANNTKLQENVKTSEVESEATKPNSTESDSSKLLETATDNKEISSPELVSPQLDKSKSKKELTE